jgi:hypothetical protein
VAEVAELIRCSWTMLFCVLEDQPGAAELASVSASDDYLEKSPDAARMGKAAEYLVAASAILATRGELNVSTSLVDDDGVDLVFHRRNHTATLSVQVKSRMSDGALVRTGRVQANVRDATIRPRSDLDMLFVVVDPAEGRITVAWLVPSVEFAKLVSKPNHRGRRVFVASMKPDSADRWRPWRLSAAELAPRVLARLAELDGG